jgi:hypothetical protein
MMIHGSHLGDGMMITDRVHDVPQIQGPARAKRPPDLTAIAVPRGSGDTNGEACLRWLDRERVESLISDGVLSSEFLSGLRE